jgi:acetyl esterase/lipase
MFAAYTAQTYASLTGIRPCSVDCRIPPEHPYPAGLDDCVEAYRSLVERFDPGKIALEGSSAGANLVAATILRARDEGLLVPGTCSLHTAGVDLPQSGHSFTTSELIDAVLRKSQPETMLLYAGGHDRAHSYLSPVFDVSRLRYTRYPAFSDGDDAPRPARAGVEAELHVFEAMPHGGLSGAPPEDHELQQEIADFISSKLS